VCDVVGLGQEECISVGARDRTARFWKVIEESQLIFRGDGPSRSEGTPKAAKPAEGSIDRLVMVDEDTFVTGSDNGNIRLWSVHRKKPIFTVPLAHGMDDPQDAASAPDSNSDGARPQPRWITALTTVPYSDLVLSGSWDGQIRIWRISDDKRRIEPVTPDPVPAASRPLRGVVTDLAVFERGDRGQQGLSASLPPSPSSIALPRPEPKRDGGARRLSLRCLARSRRFRPNYIAKKRRIMAFMSDESIQCEYVNPSST
jgi:ribosomal RNA-processing protein 9